VKPFKGYCNTHAPKAVKGSKDLPSQKLVNFQKNYNVGICFWQIPSFYDRFLKATTRTTIQSMPTTSCSPFAHAFRYALGYCNKHSKTKEQRKLLFFVYYLYYIEILFFI
jgi:hypothetical protein